jgi:ribose transport system substrate-binding protein
MDIAKSMKEPTKTAVILGPSELAVSHVTVDAMKAASAAYPNMDVVADSYTDYTDAGGLTATQNLLQAHPDLGAVILQYGGQTGAAIRAISQAGKTDQVRVYEAGGDAKAKQELLDGDLTLSSAQSPYSAAYCAVEMLTAVHHGTKVPRVVYNDCNNQSGDDTQTKPLILTKENVSHYIPDY